MNLSAPWTRAPILYNGATGGIGSYLAPLALTQGHQPIAFKSRLGDHTALEEELNQIQELISGSRQLLLCPLAAKVSVVQCQQDPESAFLINVTAMTNFVTQIVKWAHQLDIEIRVLYPSSAHIYAPRECHERMPENATIRPRSVYAETKYQGELALTTLAENMKFPLVITRIFGVIAPQQAPQYVLPGLIRRAQSRDITNVPGLDCVRDYLDARDICRAIMALGGRATLDHNVEIVNICSGRGVRIRDLLTLILKADIPESWPSIAEGMTAAPGRKDDILSIVGDPTTFERVTGCHAQTLSLEETIAEAHRLQAIAPAVS